MSFRLVSKSVILNDLERRNFTEFGSFPGAGWRYTDTFCGRICIAIFANVTENECIIHGRSHVTGCHHLLIATFKFNCKSDCSMMANLPLLNRKCCYFVVRVRCRRKKVHVRCLISWWASCYICDNYFNCKPIQNIIFGRHSWDNSK